MGEADAGDAARAHSRALDLPRLPVFVAASCIDAPATAEQEGGMCLSRGTPVRSNWPRRSFGTDQCWPTLQHRHFPSRVPDRAWAHGGRRRAMGPGPPPVLTLDCIIFGLQRVGGISNYWAQLI